MSFKKCVSVSIAALGLVATPAMAQVTASELWAEWQVQSEATGSALSATVEETADGIVLRDFTSVAEDPDVTVTQRADAVTLTENGDGTVSVDLGETYVISIAFEDGPGRPVLLEANLVHEGLEITAGGTVEAREYAYTADRVAIEGIDIVESGGNPPAIGMLLFSEGVDARYVVDASDPDDFTFTSSSSVARTGGNFDVTPDNAPEGRLKVSFFLGASNTTGEGSLGSLADFSRLEDPDFVPEDFNLAAGISYNDLSVEIDFRDGFDDFTAFYSNGGGAFEFVFSEERMRYSVESEGAEFQLNTMAMPVPVNATVESAAFVFDMPVDATPEPAPFEVRLGYQELNINEELWSMFDPGGALPRDPLSVVLDLSGAMRWYESLLTMNPETVVGPPAELREVTLNTLRLSVGEAELGGTGNVSFTPGIPIPEAGSSVELTLDGGLALLDRLQSSGLVPQQQIGLVRGMLDGFTRPGATPDSLETTIAVGGDGNLTANGVPLPF